MLVPADLFILPTHASALACDSLALKILVRPGLENVPNDCHTGRALLREGICLALPSLLLRICLFL